MQIINIVCEEDRGLLVERSAMLHRLLDPLPKNMLQSEKKVEDFACDSRDANPANSGETVDEGCPMFLVFESGPAEKFDAVVGADGVHSITRRYIHRKIDRELNTYAEPVAWHLSSELPLELAEEELGVDYFGGPWLHGRIGRGAYIQHEVIKDGTVVLCTIYGIGEEEPATNSEPAIRALLEKLFVDWEDGSIAKKMINVSKCRERLSQKLIALM